MQRDDRGYEDYAEETQNAGLCVREHDGSLMTREDRRMFGINDAVLRRREEASRMLDENRYPEYREN